jgi:DNA-binding LacI/PurR family transcriptional regulator
MSTIRDVAEAAGVSIATVSRALHGQPRVSEATRRRVVDAATSLRYVASPSAASLASGQTMAIGVVAPFVSRWFFSGVVHAAEEMLRAAGYDLLLYSLGTDAGERQRAFSGDLLRKRVDGVLVLGLQPDHSEQDALSASGRPVAIVGMAVPGWASVRIDDYAAGPPRDGPPDGPGPPADRVPRRAPRRRAARQRGDRPAGRAGATRCARRGARVGRARRDRRVHGARGQGRHGAPARPPERPSAVFAASDEMAIAAAWTARRAGLRVPEDVSVVGIDDHEMAELFELTTVAQPVELQGALAAEMLLTALADPDTPPTQLVVPTELVVRGTTAPPPG